MLGLLWRQAMSRSAAVRTNVPEVVQEPLPQPELVAAPSVVPGPEPVEEYARVGEELKEEDRLVVEGWVESLRARAGDVRATRDAWEALATVFAALVAGVVLCYFLAHL
jgi:hypothetical protein